MTNVVPADQIDQIVGAERHPTRHYARAVSSEQTVYILHSTRCKSSGIDLRDCRFSTALDRGIEPHVWAEHEDKTVRVAVTRSGWLVPVVAGMDLSR